MKTLALQLFGHSNVRFYMHVNNKYGLVSSSLNQSLIKDLEQIFNVPLISMSMAGTPLIGLFCSGNDDILFVPDIITDDEISVLKAHKIRFEILETRFTALGNNIACDNKACLINPEFEDSVKKKLSKHFSALGEMTINKHDQVGSLIAMNKNGLAVAVDASDEEIAQLERFFGFDPEHILRTTINNGVKFVHSGIVVNDYGLVVGQQSTGVESSDLYVLFKG